MDFCARYLAKASEILLSALARPFPSFTIILDESRIMSRSTLLISILAGGQLISAPVQIIPDMGVGSTTKEEKHEKLQLGALHSMVLAGAESAVGRRGKRQRGPSATTLQRVTAARSLFGSLSHALDQMTGFHFGFTVATHPLRPVKHETEERREINDGAGKRFYLYDTLTGSSLFCQRGCLRLDPWGRQARRHHTIRSLLSIGECHTTRYHLKKEHSLMTAGIIAWKYCSDQYTTRG